VAAGESAKGAGVFEKFASGFAVGPVGFDTEDAGGTEGLGGTESRTCSASGVEDGGVLIDEHREEVAKHRLGFVGGVMSSVGWG